MTWGGELDLERDLDELVERYFQDMRILAADVAARRGEPIPENAPLPGYDGRLFDWLTEMLNYGSADGPDRAWPIILTLIAQAPDENTLVFIGSGALEDLVNMAGTEFQDRIIDLAERDPRFRVALGAVWQHDTVPPTLSALIEASRSRVREEG
jgi:hypothetical protein